MTLYNDLLASALKWGKSITKPLWEYSRGGGQEEATLNVMDAIIRDSSFKTVFEAIMISTSASQAVRNASLTGPSSHAAASLLGNTSMLIGTALALTDISVINASGLTALTSLDQTKFMQDIWEKALAVPNIEGIPISTANINTVREVDVGEHPMIVQSSKQKQYWTDNAVPKLKQWTIEGYITTQMNVMDSLFLIKPSLQLQIDFLDTCSISRRPVLFKDNRGTFRFVQIMNLQTTEEADYNNAIKVTISLKEYKPFEIASNSALLQQASTDISILDAIIDRIQQVG